MRRLTLPDVAFRSLAHHLADFNADYLEKLPLLPSYPPGVTGRQTQSLFSAEIPWEGQGAAAFDSLRDVFELSRPASPRFFTPTCVIPNSCSSFSKSGQRSCVAA